MDRRKSATLISGTSFEQGKPLHASRPVGASHIGPFPRWPWQRGSPARREAAAHWVSRSCHRL